MSQTLQRLRIELIDDESLYDRSLFMDALDSLSIIGREKIYELSKEVYLVLDCWNETLRSEAVATLGFSNRLHLPEFKDKAYEIFLNDLDEDVKSTALSAWISYTHDTKSKNVIATLYKILIDQSYSINIRANAYCGIFLAVISDYSNFNPYATLNDLLRSNTQQEFNQKIDWFSIKEIMFKYSRDSLESE